MPGFDLFVNKAAKEASVFLSSDVPITETNTNIHCESIDDLELRLPQIVRRYGLTNVSIINIEEEPKKNPYARFLSIN